MFRTLSTAVDALRRPFTAAARTGVAWAGVAWAGGLCGCGATELAATEDPDAAVAAEIASPLIEAEVPQEADVAAAAIPDDPVSWDFFGPPPAVEAAQDVGPATDDLHLRGFWEFDGRRMAQLWLGDEDGGGRILLLAAGESRDGVTVVKLGEETVTVEHQTVTVEQPERKILRVSDGRRGGSARTARAPAADRAFRSARPRPARPSSSRPSPRPSASLSTPFRPRVSPGNLSETDFPRSAAFGPPPPPPPPPLPPLPDFGSPDEND